MTSWISWRVQMTVTILTLVFLGLNDPRNHSSRFTPSSAAAFLRTTQRDRLRALKSYAKDIEFRESTIRTMLLINTVAAIFQKSMGRSHTGPTSWWSSLLNDKVVVAVTVMVELLNVVRLHVEFLVDFSVAIQVCLCSFKATEILRRQSTRRCAIFSYYG